MSFGSSTIWNYFYLIKKKNRKNYTIIIMQKFKKLSAMNQEDYQLYNKLCMLRNNLQEKFYDYNNGIKQINLFDFLMNDNF